MEDDTILSSLNIIKYIHAWREDLLNSSDNYHTDFDIAVNIEVDSDTSHAYVTFSTYTKKHKWINGKAEYVTEYNTFGSEVVSGVGKIDAGNFTPMVNELSNDKAGVDKLIFDVRCIIEHKKIKDADYAAKTPSVYQNYVNASIVVAELYSGDNIHHNYKPAVVQVTYYGYIKSVGFYKNGKEQIPPEQMFPSRIHLGGGGSVISNTSIPKELYPNKIIKSLFDRVPKRRWEALNKLRSYMRSQVAVGSNFERFCFDGKEIPKDVMELIQYPLDESDMFTLMLLV